MPDFLQKQVHLATFTVQYTPSIKYGHHNLLYGILYATTHACSLRLTATMKSMHKSSPGGVIIVPFSDTVMVLLMSCTAGTVVAAAFIAKVAQMSSAV